MKSVLISIQPKWCKKIANGEKTIEVRKTAPKEVPFKCYIYCTKSDVHNALVIGGCDAELIYCCNYNSAIPVGGVIGNGKVIGEFVCDKITTYVGEFWDDETAEEVRERYEPSDFNEYGEYEYPLLSSSDNDDEPLKGSGLSWEDCREYFGEGDCTFYGWHITDLKIYDLPKELSEFRKPCPFQSEDCEEYCKYADLRIHTAGTDELIEVVGCNNRVTRPPQSWQYVEEIKK